MPSIALLLVEHNRPFVAHALAGLRLLLRAAVGANQQYRSA